ncbi:hypothetical protein XELAEV_18022663mg [Xenopus laevis]|uniref:Uncharacterized protein n=1 Tax=Xenopus laevis TaxID=8355 RepID=A0A974D5G1_XENLA|nr:hypothetical protein XELAEV_18022663mg [Xenopus laevis]
MAGKLDPREVQSIQERLSGIIQSLDASVKSLDECQKKLDKSLQCQDHLNHCLKPIQTGFVPNKNEKGSSDAARI